MAKISANKTVSHRIQKVVKRHLHHCLGARKPYASAAHCCEPLIPILMYPAAKSSVSGLLLVTLVFAATTIGTMLTVVYLARKGIASLEFPRLQRYSHAIAGATILICGLAIQFMGL